jgi:uncharacterized protein with NRDE domain
MCLIGLALDAHPGFGVVIAANRDEHFDRPSAGLGWWRSAADAPWLLAGRDLRAGGTWLGLSEAGRIGMLTNVRDRARQRLEASSRGSLVTEWLEAGRLSSRDPAPNPFNLIGGDLIRDAWWWTNDPAREPHRLSAGVHGLSNASLDTPWPKLRRLKAGMTEALSASTGARGLCARLMDLLSDRTAAADAELPDTGVGLERERALSPAFIALPAAGYGTRCSTVLLGRRAGTRWQLSITERCFDADGQPTDERTVALEIGPEGTRRPEVVRRGLS